MQYFHNFSATLTLKDTVTHRQLVTQAFITRQRQGVRSYGGVNSVPPSLSDLPASPSSVAEEAKSHSRERRQPPPPVAMETSPGGKQHAPAPAAGRDGGAEDDKDRIMLEIVQMYQRQQEKLNSTLQKQLQLEMVRLVEALFKIIAICLRRHI